MTDWKERTLAHWDKINRLAERRFGRGSLAEEAALAVLDGLEANGWQRVSCFRNQASFSTFLLAVSARLLEDFSRKKFGRVRPPLWVKRFGGMWEKLFAALCLERLPLVDAVAVVMQRQENADPAEIETAAHQLLARIPDCGIFRGRETSFTEDNCPGEPDEDDAPHQSVEEREQSGLFAAVYQLILGQEVTEADQKLLDGWCQTQFFLKSDERLLLKLCYQDGLTVSRAGAMLGLNRFQAHGRMRRLLVRIKEAFAESGLDKVIVPLLDENA